MLNAGKIIYIKTVEVSELQDSFLIAFQFVVKIYVHI